MSCFVLSNLVVTAGMLTPGLGVSIPKVSFRNSNTNPMADDWYHPLANNQSIAQRSYQQCQCQQIDTTIGLQDHTILLPCCRRILLCGTWPQCSCSTIKTSIASYKDNSYKIGTICGGCKCRSFECVLDA